MHNRGAAPRSNRADRCRACAIRSSPRHRRAALDDQPASRESRATAHAPRPHTARRTHVPRATHHDPGRTSHDGRSTIHEKRSTRTRTRSPSSHGGFALTAVRSAARAPRNRTSVARKGSSFHEGSEGLAAARPGQLRRLVGRWRARARARGSWIVRWWEVRPGSSVVAHESWPVDSWACVSAVIAGRSIVARQTTTTVTSTTRIRDVIPLAVTAVLVAHVALDRLPDAVVVRCDKPSTLVVSPHVDDGRSG